MGTAHKTLDWIAADIAAPHGKMVRGDFANCRSDPLRRSLASDRVALGGACAQGVQLGSGSHRQGAGGKGGGRAAHRDSAYCAQGARSSALGDLGGCGGRGLFHPQLWPLHQGPLHSLAARDLGRVCCHPARAAVGVQGAVRSRREARAQSQPGLPLHPWLRPSSRRVVSALGGPSLRRQSVARAWRALARVPSARWYRLFLFRMSC
mmetsp:Transcript_85056/g.259827  ORF Transcript_85056/g.259827 Transcript_85056/m.259827 type:complete len:207 (-) Transcript_85056:116-736(-)